MPLLMRKGTMYGSMSPARFACITPVWREKPKLLSTLFPSRIAQMEQLPPRWQEMTLSALPSFTACWAMYPWDAP